MRGQSGSELLMLRRLLLYRVVESCVSASFWISRHWIHFTTMYVCAFVWMGAQFLFDAENDFFSPENEGQVLRRCFQDQEIRDQEGEDEGDSGGTAAGAGSSEAITDFVVVISIPFCQGRADRFHLNA